MGHKRSAVGEGEGEQRERAVKERKGNGVFYGVNEVGLAEAAAQPRHLL